MEKNGSRHNARKLALGVLFCEEFLANQNSNQDQTKKPALNLDECLDVSMDALEMRQTEQIDSELTEKLIAGVRKNIKDIDDIIGDCAPEWPIDKIAKIDLIVLRIAVFEILYSGNTPEKVAIDEAVELCKAFGGENSSKFVNGVLGTVVEIKKSIK